MPPDFHRQYRQKIRRATHLIEATISNLDLLRHPPRPFSRFFYPPLRVYMYLATPALFFTGSVLFVVGLALAFPLLAIGVLGLFALIGYFWRGQHDRFLRHKSGLSGKRTAQPRKRYAGVGEHV
ncbi:hypothetical protein [Methanoculleus chikugoensis]|uniref:hypothetical protein n=1 Tax=Methanoculleus chikugoensis TaxID=118126 RepID=UPI0006D11478|nr:hypothetical protein [Methanoculleus chikugoensis]